MTANSPHTEAKRDGIFVGAVKSQLLLVTTLAEVSGLALRCSVSSAPVGGAPGSQQTILHEEQ